MPLVILLLHKFPFKLRLIVIYHVTNTNFWVDTNIHSYFMSLSILAMFISCFFSSIPKSFDKLGFCQCRSVNAKSLVATSRLSMRFSSSFIGFDMNQNKYIQNQMWKGMCLWDVKTWLMCNLNKKICQSELAAHSSSCTKISFRNFAFFVFAFSEKLSEWKTASKFNSGQLC